MHVKPSRSAIEWQIRSEDGSFFYLPFIDNNDIIVFREVSLTGADLISAFLFFKGSYYYEHKKNI